MATMMLPVEVHDHVRLCPACQGHGVTGARYRMPAGDTTLLVDVICPACTGCGNGDPDHAGCAAEWHARDDTTYDSLGEFLASLDDEDEPDDECGGEPACFSCGSGRGWWPCLGFAGEGPDTVAYTLRVPCGCATARMVEVADV